MPSRFALMAGRYVTPEYDVSPFTCPHVECQTLAPQESSPVFLRGGLTDDTLFATYCTDCAKTSIWYRSREETDVSRKAAIAYTAARIKALDTGQSAGSAPTPDYHDTWKLVFPATSQAPDPNTDLPADVRRDYDEAAAVLPHSARAAAALLRLAVQRICVSLGEDGKSIDKDIGALVKKGKISESLQRAMDTVRITGNESVHPGTLDVSDDPDLALALFHLVNRIAEKAFTEPRETAELYAKMPENKRKGVADRDGTPPAGSPQPTSE